MDDASRDGLPMTTRQLRHEWNTENEMSIPFANCRNSWRTFAEFEWNVDATTLELLMGHSFQVCREAIT